MSFRYDISARRPQALLTIVGVWGVLLFLYAVVDAAWWIVLPVAVLTLPALYEYGRGSISGLEIGNETLRWHSPRSSGTVKLADIEYIRFDTRLDLAVNARLHLRDNRIVRLPPETVPPLARIVPELEKRGIKHQRHHFGFT